jgi:hypothetical protein
MASLKVRDLPQWQSCLNFKNMVLALSWFKHPLEPLAAWFSISLSLDEHQRAEMAAAASKPLFTQSPMPMPR